MGRKVKGSRMRAAACEAIARVPFAESVLASFGHRFASHRLVSSMCYHFGEALMASGRVSERSARVGRRASLRVEINEHMYRSIYFFGTHEPETSSLLNALVRPGDRWLDLGANAGVFTIAIAEIVGPGGRVIAYEPNVILADRLARSAEDNGFGHVVVRNVAVGASPGVATLHVPVDANETPGGSGRASLLPSHAIGATRPVQVDVVRIDDDVPAAEVIDGIKMDVEGFESAAIEGMRHRLSHRPPRVVLFEAMASDAALSTPTQLVRAFESFGYVCFHVPTKRRITGSDVYRGGLSDNLLAIQGDAVGSVTAEWRSTRAEGRARSGG